MGISAWGEIHRSCTHIDLSLDPGAGNTFLGGWFALWRLSILYFSKGEFSWEGMEKDCRVLVQEAVEGKAMGK